MSAISFQVENWFDCKNELQNIFEKAWKELEFNNECLPLSIDNEYFDDMAKNDNLCIIVVRNNQNIVGYCVLIIGNHIHSKDSLTAYTSSYYLLPEFRKGYSGVKLFTFLQKVLKEKGINRIITTTKTQHDKSPIFKKLKWDKIETVYSKILN
jgi:hypothetical protein